MVRPLGNAKFVCKQCGWSKSMYFESDQIYGKPESCLKCGCTEFRLEKDKSLVGKFIELCKFK